MSVEINEALEELNRSAIHVQDEVKNRMERARLVRGDKATKETLAQIKHVQTAMDKLYDDLENFAPKEPKEEPAAKTETKEK